MAREQSTVRHACRIGGPAQPVRGARATGPRTVAGRTAGAAHARRWCRPAQRPAARDAVRNEERRDKRTRTRDTSPLSAANSPVVVARAVQAYLEFGSGPSDPLSREI